SEGNAVAWGWPAIVAGAADRPPRQRHYQSEKQFRAPAGARVTSCVHRSENWIKSRAPGAAAPALAAAARLRPSVRWERAALPGAPMARRAGGGKSAGWPAWRPASFSPVQGRAVGKPRNPPAQPQGRKPGGRAI